MIFSITFSRVPIPYSGTEAMLCSVSVPNPILRRQPVTTGMECNLQPVKTHGQLLTENILFPSPASWLHPAHSFLPPE